MKRFIHYAKKVVTLGPAKSFKVLQNRVATAYKSKKLKQLALAKKANHSWQMIARKHRLEQPFDEFLEQLKQNCNNFFPEKILQPFAQDKEIEKKAEQFIQNRFDLLGSGPVLSFVEGPVSMSGGIDWFVDFRLQNQNPKADCYFSKNRFYQELQVSDCKTEELAKDIKLPWELSRCYHFAVLGEAYRRTENKKYADAFVNQTQDWIKNNPVMLGPNWMCPMDVAIRAINWVAGFHDFMKSCPKKSENGRRRVKDCDLPDSLVFSLYDHFIFLQNNWEIYDSRTSNHYLSDLVGYFFLCFFFQNLSGVEKKKQWCYREILREFDKQVFDEGTDYEGSTAYHGLVAELFYLFYELCKKNNMLLPEKFEKKLAGMFEFIDWCTPEGGQLIKIGDDDSGKILFYGVTPDLIDRFKKKPSSFAQGYGGQVAFSADFRSQKTFPEFGLSIIKTKKWHISLRHHAYNKKQPSGHFHNDVGSVTLAVDGIPIFVDPGSFVYTPSSVWRNRFRSVQAHNTFYLKGHEPAPFEDFLFTLGLPEKKVSVGQGDFILRDDLYKRFGLQAQRTVQFDEEKNKVTISDMWSGKPNQRDFVSCHNFTLAPDIELEKKENDWIFLHNKKPIARLSSNDLDFKIVPGWFSPGYGKKVPTNCLRAQVTIKVGTVFEIEIEI